MWAMFVFDNPYVFQEGNLIIVANYVEDFFLQNRVYFEKCIFYF